MGLCSCCSSARTRNIPNGGDAYDRQPAGETVRRATRLRSAGDTQGALANHRKRWGAKPEAVGRSLSRNAGSSYARSAALYDPRGGLANHGKLWDAKPEAKARDSALSPFGCMANRGKPWDAKPEAKGCAGLLAPHAGPTVRRQSRHRPAHDEVGRVGRGGARERNGCPP